MTQPTDNLDFVRSFLGVIDTMLYRDLRFNHIYTDWQSDIQTEKIDEFFNDYKKFDTEKFYNIIKNIALGFMTVIEFNKIMLDKGLKKDNLLDLLYLEYYINKLDRIENPMFDENHPLYKQ